ncbi:hypothetical protein V2W45_5390 [Cenococcum geophilum]
MADANPLPKNLTVCQGVQKENGHSRESAATADIWDKAAGLPCHSKCKHDLKRAIRTSEAQTSENAQAPAPCKAKVNKRRLPNRYLYTLIIGLTDHRRGGRVAHCPPPWKRQCAEGRAMSNKREENPLKRRTLYREGQILEGVLFLEIFPAVWLPRYTKGDYPIRTGIVKGKSNNRWKSRKIYALGPTSAVQHDSLYHVCRGKQKTNTQSHFRVW